MYKILIIRNIYKPFLCNDTVGLGDFIKGSLYLHNLSKKLNFILKINFRQHIINKYLLETDNIDITNDIPCYINIDQLENIIKEKVKEQEKTTTQLEFNLFTNKFPKLENLTEDDYAWFKNTFVPNDILKKEIDSFIKANNLEENFDVIHIRCGDPFIREGIIIDDITIFNLLYSEYINRLNDLNKKCVLLSDYDKLGEILNKNYRTDFISTKYKPIHSGNIDASSNDSSETIIGTLFELFLMAKAKNIYNFSVYQWPSNYSFWIAKSYKINFKYIQLIKFAKKVIDHLLLKLVYISNNNLDVRDKYLKEIKKFMDYNVLIESPYLYLYH
jgi:hypothetical protein